MSDQFHIKIRTTVINSEATEIYVCLKCIDEELCEKIARDIMQKSGSRKSKNKYL